MKISNPYKEPVGFTVRFFLASRKWLVWAIIIIAACLLFISAIGLYRIIIKSLGSSISLFTDPALSGLVGVLIGGMISGVTSYYLHLEQLKSKAMLSKQETIYKPLYKALIEFQIQLVNLPYSCINLFGDTYFGEPSFLIWSQIKKEAKLLETSIWLARALDRFTQDIEKYNQDYRSVSKLLEDKFIKRLKDEGYLQEAHGFRALTLIMLGRYNIEGAPFSVTKFVNKEAVQKFETWEELPLIYAEYGKIEVVQNLRLHYQQNIIARADWLINELSRIIQYIDCKFGSQNPLV